MPSPDPERLRGIKTFPSLLKYLRDDLDWPIDIDCENFDDLTFDFEPEEFGIDPKTSAKIESIQQLRPLSFNQPWGIFFVKFESKKLPIVALRRILGQLVIKNRASANRSDQQTWRRSDLLFLSSYGKNEQRQITFAHFSGKGDSRNLPTLKVLDWDDSDTTLYIDHVHTTLEEKLRWPHDENNVDTWRKDWSSAFTLRYQEVIETSKDLAVSLARLAQQIRKRTNDILSIETENGPLRKLVKGFKEALIHDLTEDAFADMYAQTIAYGLLSARITNPKGDNPDELFSHIPITSPFLKELMETFLSVGGRNGGGGGVGVGSGIDFDELGINEVVGLLDNSNMEAVIRDFGDKNPREDPVIHFYELFLQEYDSQIRMERGVFYTPRPIVSFIVRSVDEVLRKEFKLEDGLADTTTWGEMAERNEKLKIPEGTTPNDPFVQILDPATGTGTFLVEVINLIHNTLIEKWKGGGHKEEKIKQLWNDYVPKHLLPRVHGYELLMAPYAIAHMKVGLKLHETGYAFGSDERTRIYLTNTLEPAQDYFNRFAFEIPALAHEAEAVNEIKKKLGFTVVIGNPPYSGVSSNKNEWINGLLKGEDGLQSTKSNYYEVDGKPLGERKVWLKDDYVKFIRFSHFLLERSSFGVHGMITNHSYVDSPTCRGMRFQILKFFSTLKVIDLHGSTKKQEIPPDGIADKNVFDILPGVAIGIFSRSMNGNLDKVNSFDLWATRSEKFSWLLKHGLSDVDWIALLPKHPYHLLVDRQLDFSEEYHSFFSLKDIFPFYGTGIQTSRDKFATDYERKKLEDRMRLFFNPSLSDKDVIERFQLRDTDFWNIREIRQTSNFKKVKETITHCLFRPFDMTWMPLTKDIVHRPRLEVMGCVGTSMPGFLCSRQQSAPGFRHILAVNTPVEMCCISNKSREGQTLFPLMVNRGEGLFRISQPNIGKEFERRVNALLLENSSKSYSKELSSKQSRQVFNYTYALLYSPAYRIRYIDLLRMDYPRVPLSDSLKLFLALSKLGDDLVALHLMNASKLDNHITEVVGSGEFRVEKVSYSDKTVWINKAKSRGFEGVPEEVWHFHIGGYQVCEKWLKDRQAKEGKTPHPGRVLMREDIKHYQKIIVVIIETIRIMGEIDEVIEEHGGWPGAFVTESGKE